MEWIERLNSAVNYIEENIKETIDLEEVSKIACCSTYHFQRMFAYIADIPLSEYIRRRRMSLAAVDLQSGNEKVIDISLKYGYDSPTAFNRAFKSVHGIAPSQAKEEGTILKAFPPISFKITIKGDSEMNYRIEKKESFRIVGVSEPLEAEIEKNFEIVPKMWGTATMNGTIPRLATMMDGMPMGMLGVSSCNESDNWRYYIAVASSQPIENNLEEYIVPSSVWAIFSGEGSSQSIQELEKRIVTEWLPTSGYEYGNAPDIEVYLNADPENAQYEVWIPVSKGELSMVHLVYCDDKEKVLEKILDSSKTMIIRAAAGRKIPHSRVFVREKLYFMKKGTAKISATATVKSVQNFVKLSEDEIVKLLADNQEKLKLSKKQQERWHKKCMCLVEFENMSEIQPLDFDHQGNMDDWLIIEKIEDVVVGTSIPYNYDKSKF